jgi:hypothetical protein
MRTRIRALAAVISATLVVGLFAGTATAAKQKETSWWWGGKAKLTLVHGIDGENGFPVDISVYRLAVGAQRFEDVTYGTVAGPLKVDPGIYRIAIRPAGAPKYSEPVLKRWLWLGPHANKSVVAHLDAKGAPVLSVYRNKVSDAGDGNTRITVRHNAAVGPVDVFANGGKVVSWLANPRQAVLEVPAGTYDISVALAGGGATVFGPAALGFAEDTNTIIYATLDRNGNFNPLLQVLPTA